MKRKLKVLLGMFLGLVGVGVICNALINQRVVRGGELEVALSCAISRLSVESNRVFREVGSYPSIKELEEFVFNDINYLTRDCYLRVEVDYVGIYFSSKSFKLGYNRVNDNEVDIFLGEKCSKSSFCHSLKAGLTIRN